MKVYIASRFRNKEYIRDLVKTLPEEVEVVSTWHEPDCVEKSRIWAAKKDLSEIDKATALLLVTHDCEAVPGGMHFEAGYALGKGLPVFLLGLPVHIFCDLLEPWPY